MITLDVTQILKQFSMTNCHFFRNKITILKGLGWIKVNDFTHVGRQESCVSSSKK